MKKQLLLGVTLMISSLGIAQNYLGSEYVDTKRVNEAGTIKFISFKPETNLPVRDAENVLKQITGAEGTANSLKKVKSETDLWGAQHDFYKQYFNEVEVAHKVYVVHSKSGVITSINGSYSKIEIPVALSSLKTPEEIYTIGLAKLGSGYTLPDEFKNRVPKNSLIVVSKDISGTSDRYAYTFAVVSNKPGDIEKVYMDAVTGEILKKEGLLKTHLPKNTVLTEEQTIYIDRLKELEKTSGIISSKDSPSFFTTGTADTRYSGLRQIETLQTPNGYELNDPSRFVKTLNGVGKEALVYLLFLAFGGTPDSAETALSTKYVDADNNWTSAEYAATKDDGALETHWAFSMVYDFFKTEYNRNGFDNQNSLVRTFIHPTINGSTYNASWVSLNTINPSFSGGFMFIGDGGQLNSSLNWDVVTGLDVDAHEFGHGVDSAFGNLVYEKESGALDEGFADIWGATVEAKMAPNKLKWIMGEDFVLSQPDGIRSLDNPKLFNQPNTYMGQYWKDASANCVPDSNNDKCGVHTNSGVLNHWYYLLADGGNGTNDNGYTYNVSGIGIKKAADLVYSTQASYVQSQSVYADVRDFTIQQAGVLYGANSSEVTAVKAAWCAVGVTTGGECSFLAASEAKKVPVFSIYPNPVNNELTIGTSSESKTGKLKYTITNAVGQLVQQGNASGNKVNVSLLQKGTYIISIDGKGNYKFIKN